MATQTTTQTNGKSHIIRTERGLSIDGTRKMLYDVMDFYTIGYPRDAIRDRLLLTDAQIDAALVYIDEHRAEVEAEYQQILQDAEENRRYWEERLRQHLARTPEPALPPEKAALRERLRAIRARHEAEQCNT
jgi:uncharacterized protein (DUF433 family)